MADPTPLHAPDEGPSKPTGTASSWRRIVGGTLTGVLATLLWVQPALPGFLDRVYYQGPVSDHFDGERFYNLDQPEISQSKRGISLTRFISFSREQKREPWPAAIAVQPTRPPARVNQGTKMLATWVGHSTVLVQTDGLNILTDPIWAERASPFSFTGPKRVRAPGIRFSDLPKIDIVLISHNHYDHLELDSLKKLWARDKPLIVTGLGNDSILKAADIPSTTRDWGGRVTVKPGVDIIVNRVHHWGSRWFSDRNRALWAGFTVTLPGGNLFFTGDTGWGTGSWVDEAAAYGPPRLALIAIGAFLPRDMMLDSHIGPEEALQVMETLGAETSIGVHWGTFRLSSESVNEPRDTLNSLMLQNSIAAERFQTPEPGQTLSIPVVRTKP